MTYEFSKDTEDFYKGKYVTMHFDGKEVRGIIDENGGFFISNSMWYTSYEKDAIELYTVYENGKLTGLRKATEEEQKEWDERRKTNSESVRYDEEEVVRIEHATKADYKSFLKLRTDNYKDLSVEQFNRQLLNWANDHQLQHERIMNDSIWNEYQVSLSTDEKTFVEVTTRLSNEENATYVRSLNEKQSKEDPMFNIDLAAREETVDNLAHYAYLWYQFSYHISDKNNITIGERDHAISGFMGEIESFWNQTKMQTLLTLTETDIT